jgi:hypothetical protein
LEFTGASEYLEDLVARFDAPLLDDWEITFFHQLIYDTPQLTRLISRTPMFKSLDKACVEFSNGGVSVSLLWPFDRFDGWLYLRISCRQSDWQLSSMAQVCSTSFSQILIPTVERLVIQNQLSPPRSWQDDIENSQWLELLRSFAAVKKLYISKEFMPRIAPALQEFVGERVIEVLPTLQSLFLEETLPSGPVEEAVGQFIAARQLAGHPVAVSRWEG